MTHSAGQDYRDAYFNSLGSAEEQRTLGNQAPALIKRIKDAREIYSDLLREWELQDGTSEVIYIPTEANLPILEAVRRVR